MRRQDVCLSALVATFIISFAACTSQSGSSGSGGAVGLSGTGGSGTGGIVSTGGTAVGSGGQPGTGGEVGTGGSVSGGAPGTGGATGDASVASTGDGSMGCGISGAPTGNLSAQSITVGDKTRTYALTVPKNYSPDAPLPLIFAWHGMGGSGSVARSYFHLDSAVANQAIVVYPDGLPVNDGGTGWDLTSTGIDVAFFDALLAYMSNTYCIDRNRVFTTGHSFGGFFTNILGCYRGDVLRATAPVAGMPPNTFGRATVTCAGNVAALIIHGDNDPTVDYTQGGIGGRDFWVGQNGCSTSVDPVPITPSACLESQSCQPDLPVVFCTHTEGHNWPTANGAGCSDGGICFDAGSIIWTFFSRFQ
jgi:polyhydroxybutyrate depolymerase